MDRCSDVSLAIAYRELHRELLPHGAEGGGTYCFVFRVRIVAHGEVNSRTGFLSFRPDRVSVEYRGTPHECSYDRSNERPWFCDSLHCCLHVFLVERFLAWLRDCLHVVRAHAAALFVRVSALRGYKVPLGEIEETRPI